MARSKKRQEIPFWSWRSSPNFCWLYIAFFSKAGIEDRVSLEAEWHCIGETPHINLFRCTLRVHLGHSGKQEQKSSSPQQLRTYWKQHLWVKCINSELNKRKRTKLEGIYVTAAVCVNLLLVLTLTLWAFLLPFTITSLHHGPSV